jgi:peroxin-19
MASTPVAAPAAPKVEVKKETKTTTTIGDEDSAEPSLDDVLDNDDFAKQLAAGMEQLMGQMGADAADEGNDEMKEAFEKVWASFDAGDAATAPASSTTREVPKIPQSFQETIGKTMNKLKDSSKEIDVSCQGKVNWNSGI